MTTLVDNKPLTGYKLSGLNSMRVLALSDKVVPFIYSPQVRYRFEDIDLVIGCGDLPYYYLEYVMTALDAPLFFVRGNHDKIVEYNTFGQRTHPHGGVNLHRKSLEFEGLLFAGVEGCQKYSSGSYQYSQGEMWSQVFTMVPGMAANYLKYGRYLDVFVTHAPAHGIHDKADLPHHGIKAFSWLLKVFQPTYHLHGHIHVYRPDEITESRSGRTKVTNVYAFKVLELEASLDDSAAQERPESKPS